MVLGNTLAIYMLPIVLAAGAFAAVSAQRSNESGSVLANKETEEEVENFFLGRSRDKNLFPGKTLIAENSRIIRPNLNGVQHPELAAKAWGQYHKRYEDVAHTLSNAYHAGGDHARYFRGDINKKPRRPHLPDKESFAEWATVPTAYFEHDSNPGSNPYPDMDYTWYEDQTGDAITVPGAPHYIYTNQEFLGNPWGPSGQFFNADGMRTKSKKDLQRDKIPDSIKKKNRVTFYGLPQ